MHVTRQHNKQTEVWVLTPFQIDGQLSNLSDTALKGSHDQSSAPKASTEWLCADRQRGPELAISKTSGFEFIITQRNPHGLKVISGAIMSLESLFE